MLGRQAQRRGARPEKPHVGGPLLRRICFGVAAAYGVRFEPDHCSLRVPQSDQLSSWAWRNGASCVLKPGGVCWRSWSFSSTTNRAFRVRRAYGSFQIACAAMGGRNDIGGVWGRADAYSYRQNPSEHPPAPKKGWRSRCRRGNSQAFELERLTFGAVALHNRKKVGCHKICGSY